MNIKNILKALMILVLTAGFIAVADMWCAKGPAEDFSPSRKYVLRTDPQGGMFEKFGHCQATLVCLDSKEKEQELWSRYLINNYAPHQVFVSDSGTYIVTMDEWGHMGENPVVVYGKQGRLVCVHMRDSLGLTPEDYRHIKFTMSGFWWSENSICFFGPADETFFIRLHWGKLLVVDLQTGSLLSKETFASVPRRVRLKDEQLKQQWDELLAYGRKVIAEKAILMLADKEPEHRQTGAIVCGQEKLTKAIPELRRLLNDSSAYWTNAGREDAKVSTEVYFVRKAAKSALETMGEKVENVITEKTLEARK